MKSVRIIVLLLFFYSLLSYANNQVSIVSIDSLSYVQFNAGDWDGLIETAELAKKNNIDFKWLQQRVGYAYFVKKQYYKSMRHYEKALDYDDDEISRLYLYYNGVYTGRTAFARFQASQLSEITLTEVREKQYRLTDAVDLEYSYKMPDNPSTHQGHYKRLGLNSQLGYKLNLYQSFSNFNQSTDTTQTRQNEYFVLLGWNPAAKTNISIGYHYVGSKVVYGADTFNYPGNIFYGKITQQLNRFDLALSGASFKNEWLDSKQLGVHLGVNFAGNNNINLTSSYYRIVETGLDYSYGRNVFKQTAGIMLFNRLWTEAYVNLGNLNQFIDNNGLYFYNSLDPTTFRTGISGFWYVCKPLTIYLNYNYDTKKIITDNLFYNQHSITGGLIWKI
jgi:tetratricopeptide (TPR) repeat protein